MQIGIPPLENRMIGYLDDHVKVARLAPWRPWIALALQAQAGPVIHPGRDIHPQLLFRPRIALALALLANLADHLSPAAASGARLADREKALLVQHFAAAIAGRALHHAAIRFRAATLASGASLQARHLQVRPQPLH